MLRRLDRIGLTTEPLNQRPNLVTKVSTIGELYRRYASLSSKVTRMKLVRVVLNFGPRPSCRFVLAPSLREFTQRHGSEVVHKLPPNPGVVLSDLVLLTHRSRIQWRWRNGLATGEPALTVRQW